MQRFRHADDRGGGAERRFPLHGGTGCGRHFARGDGDFLLRGLVAAVNGQGALELSQRTIQITALTQNAATVDVRGGGGKAHTLKLCLIAQVFGLEQVGLAIGLKGGIVVLAHFGVCAALGPTGG